MLILSTFNGVFWGLCAFFLLLLVLGTVILNRFTKETRAKAIIIFMTANFILFWLYKYAISVDTEYAALRAAAGFGTGTFTWWDELPLQLCNINMVLIPVALLTKKRGLLGFSFFLGPLGALMAILMPTVGFDGYSLLTPRVFGFYATHLAILTAGIGLCTLDLYRPKMKDFPRVILSILLISAVIFVVNLLLRTTGLNPHANYFFNVETENNPILNIFYGFIPIPFLYQLGCFLILIPYMFLITGITALIDKKKK